MPNAYPHTDHKLCVRGSVLVESDAVTKPASTALLRVYGTTDIDKGLTLGRPNVTAPLVVHGAATIDEKLTCNDAADILARLTVGTNPNPASPAPNPPPLLMIHGPAQIADLLTAKNGAHVTGQLSIDGPNAELLVKGAQPTAPAPAPQGPIRDPQADADLRRAIAFIDELEAGMDPGIPRPGLKIKIDPGTFLRQPVLRVVGGFMAQIDASVSGPTERDPDSLELADKFITIGTSPFLPDLTGVATPPRGRKARYGLMIHWPSKGRTRPLPHFSALQMEQQAGGPTKDAVLSWGKHKKARFIFRFIGKLKNSKNRTGNVVAVYPTGHVRVYGSVTSHFHELSDVRFKDAIEPIPGALNKVMAMRGVHYTWKRDEFPEENFSDRRQLGMIAQEVEAICPELVSKDPDNGHKTLDYTRLTPVLLEAIKDQQKTILAQQARLDRLEEALRKLGALS